MTAVALLLLSAWKHKETNASADEKLGGLDQKQRFQKTDTNIL